MLTPSWKRPSLPPYTSADLRSLPSFPLKAGHTGPDGEWPPVATLLRLVSPPPLEHQTPPLPRSAHHVPVADPARAGPAQPLNEGADAPAPLRSAPTPYREQKRAPEGYTLPEP